MQVNVAGLRRNIKNIAHNYSSAQVKVRAATSNDPWGASATLMAELAEYTNNVVAFSEIMQIIWKRLNDHGKNWRHVYKALILLEYLIRTGNEKVAQQCKENIFAINTLREFAYFEDNHDHGACVREKAKQLVNLLNDDELLKNERIKALKAKERFAKYPSGFGSDGTIDGPPQRDTLPDWQKEPTKAVSELEMVRPQTAGEEELQLQLAMAMSREEAEQEEAKRRSDDVRLQLALSQSEQDFKVQKQHKEEPQSHLLDLLDIQLGATNISSPPLGLAAGGLTNNSSDPWVTPARAASQMSDPWTGTASPPADPWLPTAAASRSTPLGSAQMGAVGGLGISMATNGTNGAEAWSGLRTQSPSVTSGSSTEGWLQTNGNTQSCANVVGAVGGVPTVDPWLSKQSVSAQATLISSTPLDRWLTENAKSNTAAVPTQSKLLADDPWALKALTAAANDDPWKNIENTTTAKKPSPDMDEFDIITNRSKTGDLTTINDSTTNISNNNALLLDDLDPLSSTNMSGTNSTGAIAKRPLKDPQSFLGENSGLVNLDNLIKPAVPQNATANAPAYNPFSDTVIPPKTNLFQQQQPAVPSINQLKQQSFQMTINQDPWAPVKNVAVAQLLSFDSPPHTAPIRPTTLNFTKNIDYPSPTDPVRPTTLNFNNNNNNNSVSQTFSGCNDNSSRSNFNINNSLNSTFSTTMKHSQSNYDALRSISLMETAENEALSSKSFNSNLKTSYTLDNLRGETFHEDSGFLNSSDVFNTQNNKNISYSSLYPHVEIVNNNQLYSKSPPSSPLQQSSPSLSSFVSYAPLTPLTSQDTVTITHNYNNNNNSNHYYNNTNNNNNNSSHMMSSSTALGNASATKSFGPNYSHALSASLAFTPGVTIMPLNSQTSSDSNLFNYGFYESNNDFFNTQCKLENNNNTPWIKPEASASNPFLS